MGIKLYDETKNYPYYKKRQNTEKSTRRKSNNRHTEYNSSNLLSQAEENKNNMKCAFYPSSQETLANKTLASNEASSCNNEVPKNNTYFKNWGNSKVYNYLEEFSKPNKSKNEFKIYGSGKESMSTKNTSLCNQTTEMSLENKPLSQRKSFINEKNKDRKLELDQQDYNTRQVKNGNQNDEASLISKICDQSFNRKTKVEDLIYCEDNK